MISVSIRPFSDTVVITWKPSGTAGIDGYVLHEYKNSGSSGWVYIPIRWISNPLADSAIFRYPKVRQQAVRFNVAAYKNYPPPIGLLVSDPSDLAKFHKTIFTKLTNDSCNSRMLITWSNYYGWGNKLGHYRIFQKKDNGVPSPIVDNILPADTTYAITVEPNKNYCFYVCAVNQTDTTSFSNDSCLFTKMAIPPNFINADFASFNPNSKTPVNVRFSLDINSQLNKYQLYTSDNADNGFTTVGSPIIANKDSIVIVDTQISNSPKYYKLEVLNNCGNTSVTSNIATAMVLRGSVQSSQVNLIWNEYKGWGNGVQDYTVYKVIGNESAQPAGPPMAATDFTDDITQLLLQQLSGNICYYVEATSKPDNLGKVNKSRSSNFCIDLSELVFVPNAFTPNGDGRNDEFKPSFAVAPTDYVLIVYNRYGFKVFESTNYGKGWDGTIGNGQKAPDGTYVYFIKFSSQTGNAIEKKGNFSLIYP